MRAIDLNSIRGATSETARDINRRILLNLIRNRQPISRADLARVSGLQRSTVSLITEELIEDRWVCHGSLGRLPRGRRPTYLRLNDKRAILGVDIRPGKITIAVSDVNAHFLSQEIIETPRNFNTAMEQIAGSLTKLVQANSEFSFDGVGVTLPGRVDPDKRLLVFAPNLGWHDVDIRTPLANATGLEVHLENAANASALAEIWFGSNHGARDLIVVTVSEGIGTGIILNGQLVCGPSGMAGEFGHTTVEPDGPTCTCGNRGCWEVFASNAAAVRNYSESADASGQISFSDLLSRAGQGDARAVKALERMAHYLGLGTSRLVNGLAPACIVFAGELTREWPRFGPIIEAEVEKRGLGRRITRIVPAEEGTMSRLRGTVALVLQKHFGAPVCI